MDKDQESVLALASGEILHFDFRSEETKRLARGDDLSRVGMPLRVATWNVERGSKLAEIEKALRTYDGDIITLQDQDSNCQFTNCVDTGLHLARALGYNYQYQQEFIEIGQGKDDHLDGAHGNAILSKFDFSDWTSVEHSVKPFDWEEHGEKMLSQPRKGHRVSMRATVQVPAAYSLQFCAQQKAEDLTSGDVEAQTIPVDVYTFHFELFCGISHRWRALQDLFSAIRARAEPYVLFMGDTNMLGHGVTRLVGHMCMDGFRHKTLGFTESAFTTLNVLDVYVEDAVEAIAQKDQEQARRILSGDVDAPLLNSKILALQSSNNKDLKGLETLLNPALSETFPPDTATVSALGGFFEAKADALMTRGCSVVNSHIGNEDFSMSNHRSLHCALFLDSRKVNKLQLPEELQGDLVSTLENDLTVNGKKYAVLPCALQGTSSIISAERWMPLIRILIVAVAVYLTLTILGKK